MTYSAKSIIVTTTISIGAKKMVNITRQYSSFYAAW